AYGDAGLAVRPEGVRLGAWRVVHGDGALGNEHLVHGHFHPWLRWSRRVAAPCYLVGRRRLVLPAFSGDAAGVNVLGDARWRRCRCVAIAGDGLLNFGELGRLTGTRAAALRGKRQGGARDDRVPRAARGKAGPRR